MRRGAARAEAPGGGAPGGRWRAQSARRGAPVRVLDGEIEAEDAKELALADEDLLLEPPELLVALGRLHRRVLHLVRLHDDVAQLLRGLLHLRRKEEARRRHLRASRGGPLTRRPLPQAQLAQDQQRRPTAGGSSRRQPPPTAAAERAHPRSRAVAGGNLPGSVRNSHTTRARRSDGRRRSPSRC